MFPNLENRPNIYPFFSHKAGLEIKPGCYEKFVEIFYICSKFNDKGQKVEMSVDFSLFSFGGLVVGGGGGVCSLIRRMMHGARRKMVSLDLVLCA